MENADAFTKHGAGHRFWRNPSEIQKHFGWKLLRGSQCSFPLRQTSPHSERVPQLFFLLPFLVNLFSRAFDSNSQVTSFDPLFAGEKVDFRTWKERQGARDAYLCLEHYQKTYRWLWWTNEACATSLRLAGNEGT